MKDQLSEQAIEIVSINVGMPRTAVHQDKEIYTGIMKRPAQGPLWLSSVNFDGDAQGDLVHHGGAEKAVCVYAFEHYAHWAGVIGKPLAYGAFGENVTTRGLTEADVCIGDIYKLGEATVQVSQPRQPCYKLAMKHGVPDLPLQVQESGYTGYYFRVLEEGMVAKQDGLTLLARHPLGVTVAFANRIMHTDKRNAAGIRAILAVDALSVNWRATLENRLAGIEPDTRERLVGGEGR